MMPADRVRSEPKRRVLGAEGLSETFVLLDNSLGRGRPSLLFTDPRVIIEAWRPEEAVDALARIEAGIASGLHAAGFLSYELGYVLEPRLARLMPDYRTVPLMWLGLYGPPQQMTSGEVDAWLSTHKRSGTYEFTDVTRAWDRDGYLRRFAEVQEMIRAGDIYQLNLTFKSRFRLEGSPLTFYQDLRRRQRVEFGAIVDTGEATVLSASPELFVAQRGRVIETRPMKGTAPRAGTPEADTDARRILASDIKQRAENLMIVDLMRNDLGRKAEIGSVEVTDLFTVETYRTLHQMTSGIRARLAPGVGLADLMTAIFPPGSVTGAPKIRAMELIRQLETEPRGVYCGSIGHIAPDGQALLNVAIRTPVVFRDGRGEMGIGSGIVFDSEGEKEYDECLLKMQFLVDPPKPFELIETMLFDGRTIWLLERHLARLEASAHYFDFALDIDTVRQALAKEIAGRQSQRLRIRLLLAEDGHIGVTSTPQPAQSPDAVMQFTISPTRLNSSDAFLYHKTTRRELYDREWKHYADTRGADEVIYLNERGELCEGSRTNLFVEKDGVLRTPELAAGLLPGTLRAELIAEGSAREARLTYEDLLAADTIYLGNSVRGLIRAERIADP